MSKKKSKISVIVPIYNVEPYLHRCVDSLLLQTYQDFELILIDDGSTDNCGMICDEYAALDDRIRVIHKLNGGLSDARNVGLEIATGEYIAFVDSDDWVARDYLECLFVTLCETGADICECNLIKTTGEKNIHKNGNDLAVYDTVDAMEKLICDEIFHQHVWNKLYHRKVIAGIMFPVGKTNEDEFWTYQVMGNAKKVAKISNILYFYFQRSGSIMNETYSLKRLDALEAKKKRQLFIDEFFPKLSSQARINLFGSSIYAGQMSMIYLSKDQQAEARKKINAVISEYKISFKECFRIRGRSKIWFILAKCSFWKTCKIRNILKKGF